MNKFPNLFAPAQIGGVVLRNRILASATGHLDINGDKSLSEGALLYYERKAIGGAASVVVGECSVDPPTASRGGITIDLTDFNSMRYLSRLSDYIQRHGAVASAELQHAGRYGAAAIGPSDGEVDGHAVRAMTGEEVEKALEQYANAAFFARMCGFRMVTVHGGHGWLPQQFFSPYYNSRKDEWGGSAENRARFAVEICDRIHARCGSGFPVEMRISATELEDGYGQEEGFMYAQALDGHADVIHVSVGVHGSLASDHWLRFSPTMFMDDGANVKYAAAIKKRVKKSLVATVGSLSDPAMMEDVIASGQADFVALARQLLCDPDLPNKAKAGKDKDVRQCLRCMSCWSNLMSGGIYCAVNPETSREREAKFALRPASRQKVLIAGGGIAGMEAAIVASENGHEVVLCEKSGQLGGGIRCEKDVPFKRHVEEYIQLQESSLARSSVDVRMNTEVTGALVESEKPDVLIAAIGALPYIPPIEGIEKAISAQSAYLSPALATGKSLIIGAGLVGMELAVYLFDLGKDVEIIEMGPAIHAPGNMTQGMAVSGELSRRKIPIRFMASARRILPEGVECETPQGKLTVAAQTVIYATGQKPLTEEAYRLSSLVNSFYAIGDCDAPGTIMGAVKTAYTVARDIGRC
jgi:2,4-dienoyl-CoA reductase-like NADH-dependent reductase (Old Yellow Enzyme family)/thioredoxin reductase